MQRGVKKRRFLAKISAKIRKHSLPIFTKKLSQKSDQVRETSCKIAVRKCSIYRLKQKKTKKLKINWTTLFKNQNS